MGATRSGQPEPDLKGKRNVDLSDMNAALGERYARGEFETRVIDGQQVEREILLRSYGFLFVEYRYRTGSLRSGVFCFRSGPKKCGCQPIKPTYCGALLTAT